MGDCLQRVARAELWKVSSIQKLQKLDDEFYISDATSPRFDIPFVGTLLLSSVFDAPFECFDSGDICQVQITPIDPRFHGIEEFRSECQVARNRPRLDECLSFPGSSHHVVIAQSRIQTVN